MPRGRRLSSGERVLLVLAALVLALLLFLGFSARQEAGERDQLKVRVNQARLDLERVRGQVDVKPLEAEKVELSRTLTSLAREVPRSEPALRLWEWAAQSGVEVVAMTYTSAPVQVAGGTFLSLKYHVQSRGGREGLAQFLGLIASSPYLPVVDNLALLQGEEGGWEMELDLLIYTQG